ncbi:cytochrome c oxidase assembly protein [Marinicella sp. S1101]|uniref:cytochrome c oxidase assembly protein n=1 Tax=Marinicella marina TaxID=2996016 RepID=UPI002260FA5E|nr:cytochrome c oxidase assembly protein [Marinicella marina]MCX7552799.1 cytochrome c oxidase assembly protein [Marinicella marina]MDJ1139892.1 cytochrome c oxidase assembly protein [Marinicella marina]
MQQNKQNRQKDNRKVLKLGIAGSLLMVGFGFALVPLYDIICDITGLNGKTGVLATSEVKEQAIDHTVTVQFDGTVNSDLPWSLKPQVFSMEVVPGKLYSTEYIAKNIAQIDVTGQAVPSVAPNEASIYFSKTECFCFTEQLLTSGEEKNMPVTFIVSPDIPKDINVLTLSYTFFNKSRLTAAQQAAAAEAHEKI